MARLQFRQYGREGAFLGPNCAKVLIAEELQILCHVPKIGVFCLEAGFSSTASRYMLQISLHVAEASDFWLLLLMSREGNARSATFTAIIVVSFGFTPIFQVLIENKYE